MSKCVRKPAGSTITHPPIPSPAAGGTSQAPTPAATVTIHSSISKRTRAASRKTVSTRDTPIPTRGKAEGNNQNGRKVQHRTFSMWIWRVKS